MRSRLMREEWTCKFCSESNVRTRWCWRRCYNHILAGLRGKHRSAGTNQEDRKTRSLEAENKELRARIDALEKKTGEGLQGVSLPGKTETWKMCGERTWTSRMRPRAVKIWMSKRKTVGGVTRCRKLSLISKETQESIKESLQHQLQEVGAKEA